MTPQEIARFRAETRGTQHVLHFNNAGSSLTPDCVHDAVVGHLEREREIGGYEAKNEAAAAIDSFYDEAAGLIGAATAAAEYSSNYLAYLQIAKRKGVVVRVVPDDASGQTDIAALRRMIDGRTKLISITHIPTHGGLVNPAAAIGQVAREHGIPYLLDACQSVGQLKVDVKTIGCDMLSATGRKFLRGPRGTGFLYVKRELANRMDPVFVDLHSADWTADDAYELAPGARRFENWECFYAGKLGLAVAIRYARAIGMERIEARVLALGALLRQELSACPGVSLTDTGELRCGIVTFVTAGLTATEVHARLRRQAINVSVSSGERARFDLLRRGYRDVVRASVHYYNTEDEIARFCAVIRALSAD
jgi:selenocysteine lyase/cysteine desulfurase